VLTAPVVTPLRSTGQRIRHSAERRPEWWVLAVSAACWVALLRLSLSSQGSIGPGSTPMSGGDATLNEMAGMCGVSRATGWWSWRPPGEAVGMWVVMTVAMMIPLTIPSLRHVARMVPQAARSAALATFCSAFVLAWIPGVALAVWIHGRPPVSAGIVAAAFVAAGVWELTPMKRRALLACHRTAVIRAAQPGRRRTCWQFGIRRGAWCTASCGPLMVALLLTGHALIPLLVVTVGLAVQRYSSEAHRVRGWSAAGFSLIAVVTLIAP